MDESYDIFRREIDGNFVWIGAEETFARAREKIVQDPASSEREFLIVNALTGVKTLIEPPESARRANMQENPDRILRFIETGRDAPKVILVFPIGAVWD
jgi:hypothetical protein